MKPGEFVVYEENESKISQVLTKKADSDKIVKHYANPNVGDKCCIGILKLYLSKLPPFFIGNLKCHQTQHGFLVNLLATTH